jgi:hypothetical protein
LQVRGEFVLPSEFAVADVAAVWCCGAVNAFNMPLLFVFATESCGAVGEIAGYAGSG